MKIFFSYLDQSFVEFFFRFFWIYFYQILLENTLIHEMLAETRNLKKENTVTILNRVEKKLDKMIKFSNVNFITHCCYSAR